jgi:MATE family multidrug resistance protein
MDYFKKTLAIAFPIILIQLIGSITGFIGMAFLAKLGHHILAASALLYSLQTMIFVISISPLFALSVLISRTHGAGEEKEIGNILQQSWMLGLILAVIIFILYSLIVPILTLFHQDKTLVLLIEPYFHLARWGAPATLMAVSCSQFLLGVGKQKLVAIISVLQMIVLLMSGYAFILGHFGMPRLGVAGWGIAYTITAWLTLFIVLAVFYFQHDFKKFYIFHVHVSNGLQHLKKLFHYGWPITIQTGGELFSFGFVMMMVGWLGIVPLAAMQVVTQFLMLMIIPAYGFSMGAGILVSRAMGAKQFSQARAFGYINFLLCLATIILFGIILNLFPENLARIFLQTSQANYQQIFSLVKTLFMIVAFAQVFDCIRNSLTGALRGLLDMRFPMFVGLICIWLLRVPLSYYLAFKLHMGVIGISYGSVVGMFIAAVIIFLRWQQKTKKFNALNVK